MKILQHGNEKVDGLELKILRIRAGLSLATLAAKYPVYQAPRICEMENGHRLVAEDLVKFLEQELEAKGTVKR